MNLLLSGALLYGGPKQLPNLPYGEVCPCVYEMCYADKSDLN